MTSFLLIIEHFPDYSSQYSPPYLDVNYFSVWCTSGLNNLLVMTSLPSMSSEALTEGLQFLTGALAQAERKTQPVSGKVFDPYSLVSQALLCMGEEQLRAWLARIVLGSSADGSSTVKHNTGLLRKFIEILTKEDG